MDNKSRQLVKIVKEICLEEKYEYQSFSYDWVIKINNENKTRFIIGYKFDLNSASTSTILDDKMATSALLNSIGIKAVDYKFYMNPMNTHYIGKGNVYTNVLEYAKSNDYKIVLKPNKGTSGQYVYKTSNCNEVEQVLFNLFNKKRDIVVSPLLNIKNEYRVIVLNSNIELVYKKNNLSVIGNGKNTLNELIKEKYNEKEYLTIINNMDKNMLGKLNDIILKDYKFDIDWRHNLSTGAQAEEVSDKDILEELKRLIEKVIVALNIVFASIDIIEVNNELLIIEINSGVMCEKVIFQIADGYDKVKEIYKKAIKLMFEK